MKTGFRVQGFRKIRNEELGMRNEGGGFAANIYGAMPESRVQVTRIAFSKSLACKSTSKSSEE